MGFFLVSIFALLSCGYNKFYFPFFIHKKGKKIEPFKMWEKNFSMVFQQFFEENQLT